MKDIHEQTRTSKIIVRVFSFIMSLIQLILCCIRLIFLNFMSSSDYLALVIAAQVKLQNFFFLIF